jgi:hypothetical protein
MSDPKLKASLILTVEQIGKLSTVEFQILKIMITAGFIQIVAY